MSGAVELGKMRLIDGNALVMLDEQVKAINRILARAGYVEFRFVDRCASSPSIPQDAHNRVSLAFVWRKHGREHGSCVFGVTFFDALAQACQVLEVEFPRVG